MVEVCSYWGERCGKGGCLCMCVHSSHIRRYVVLTWALPTPHTITLLKGVDPHNITVNCCVFNRNLNFPKHVLEHPIVILRGLAAWILHVEQCYDNYRCVDTIENRFIWTAVVMTSQNYHFKFHHNRSLVFDVSSYNETMNRSLRKQVQHDAKTTRVMKNNHSF